MRFLLTNDDGIDAPGLQTLEACLAEIGETAVVAPHEHLSGCSHRVSTDRELTSVAKGDRRFALDGTPADCTRVGLLHLAADAEWVMSGINDGGNMGVDVFMSGTVAAVREAALFGKPAIAFSRYRPPASETPWVNIVPAVKRVLETLMPRPLEPGTFWNVNFPHIDGDGTPVPEMLFCPLDCSHLPVKYQINGNSYRYSAVYQQRERTPGSDVDVCLSGRIAVTQMSIRF